jgi:hypothetical protein
MSWVNDPVSTQRGQPGARLEIFARRMIDNDFEILLSSSVKQLQIHQQKKNRATKILYYMYRNLESPHWTPQVKLPGRDIKVCIVLYAQPADDIPASQSSVTVILNGELQEFLKEQVSWRGDGADPVYYKHALWKFFLHEDFGERFEPPEFVTDLQDQGWSSSSREGSAGGLGRQ